MTTIASACLAESLTGIRHVSFAHAAPEAQADIDAAYHAEYDRYGPRIVGPFTGSGAYGVTGRLAPQPDREK